MASNRGTLMELGTGPIVNAGMFLQLLTSSGLINLSKNSKEEKEESEQL
jgi:preprotein translocase subunit SecY